MYKIKVAKSGKKTKVCQDTDIRTILSRRLTIKHLKQLNVFRG